MIRYEKRIEISKEIEVTFETPLFTGDVGNTIGLEFYLRGKPYEFTSATLFGTNKAGETVFTTAKAEGHTVVLPIVNAMFQVPVKADMQVVLYDDSGNALTSGYLHFTVIQGLSENASIEGTDEYNSLMELLAQVNSSMGQISRAEAAANEIESFLQLVEKPENSVIHQLSESEIDTFMEGCAVVTSYNSQIPNLVTGTQKWLLFASCTSGLLLNNYELSQLRYYENKLQTRKGTCSEGLLGGMGYSWDDWTDVIPDNLITYKGSKYYYSQLPTTGNSIGDVWNVAYPGEVSIKAMPITVTHTHDMVEEVGFATAHIAESFSEDTWFHSGFIYNSNGEKITEAYPSTDNVLEMPIFIETGNYYLYFTDESLQKYHTDSLTLNYETGENCKFIWNGYEWQTFTGDMSKYATKEEIGDISTALTNIESLQNSYIGGDSV